MPIIGLQVVVMLHPRFVKGLLITVAVSFAHPPGIVLRSVLWIRASAWMIIHTGVLAAVSGLVPLHEVIQRDCPCGPAEGCSADLAKPWSRRASLWLGELQKVLHLVWRRYFSVSLTGMGLDSMHWRSRCNVGTLRRVSGMLGRGLSYLGRFHMS